MDGSEWSMQVESGLRNGQEFRVGWPRGVQHYKNRCLCEDIRMGMLDDRIRRGGVGCEWGFEVLVVGVGCRGRMERAWGKWGSLGNGCAVVG